ncbi:DUF6458 family protein [Amnibacterium endophyticum]|uniref:DUF6458 family protein n=1 Tax=Amnibacterium endophyticum TaxID=2109337 RepID=A0ABW4LB38_9MICO
MSMATGVVLFVIGAILAFAVNIQTDVVSVSTIGYILMAGGAVVFVIGLVLSIRGNRSVTTSRTDGAGNRVTSSSSTTTDDRI